MHYTLNPLRANNGNIIVSVAREELDRVVSHYAICCSVLRESSNLFPSPDSSHGSVIHYGTETNGDCQGSNGFSRPD